MKPPDQRAFEADLCEAEFRIGVAEGQWGTATEEVVSDDIQWPRVVLWIASAKRPAAPDRFYVLLDCANYKSVPPTGTFWDPVIKQMATVAKRPKGKSNSRVARVFRTDWNNGTAFYHPYDRVAAQTHPNWANEQPHLIWGPDHTIVNLLVELHVLLNSEDYVGIS